GLHPFWRKIPAVAGNQQILLAPIDVEVPIPIQPTEIPGPHPLLGLGSISEVAHEGVAVDDNLAVICNPHLQMGKNAPDAATAIVARYVERDDGSAFRQTV